MSRKFRWTFEADFPTGKIETMFVKVNARPTMPIEETEIKVPGSDATSWIPGKTEWEQITTTFYDTTTEQLTPLFSILSKCYDLTGPTIEKAEDPEKWSGTVLLKLLCPKYAPLPSPPEAKIPDQPVVKETISPPPPRMGIGTLGQLGSLGFGQQIGWEPLEEWTLKQVWPVSINFGELDYSSSDCCEIQVTWRYKGAVYKSPNYTPVPQTNA